MFRFGVVLVLLVAACSPDQVLDSTTTSTSASATTSVASTVPAPPATTPEPTTPVETTTTEIPTTTVVTGNWASQPLVTSGFGALGWWNGSDWVEVDALTSLPVSGGEDYRIAVLDLTATTTGGAETIVCEPLNNIGIELAHPELLGEWPGPYGVAISAPWELTPHLVQPLSDDGTYAGFASELLASRGLVVAEPTIVQLIRVDLEGDGVTEVIVVAENIVGGFLPLAGDYSIAFLRKLVEGEVQTAILGESVIVDTEGAFPASFRVGSVSDLSGDGQMEIVLSSAYFEGLGVEVWDYFNDDIGLLPVIQAGCGL